MLGIQNRMGNIRPFQHFAQHLRFLDGDCPHEDRLTLFIEFPDLFHNRLELFPFSLINRIRKVCANHLLIGGYHRNVQFIGTIKFRSLCVRCSCHPSKFLIHPEVVLERNGRQGLVFFRHTHALFCLHSLMQAITPAATRHHAACELVHNYDLSIFYDVVHILLK